MFRKRVGIILLLIVCTGSACGSASEQPPERAPQALEAPVDYNPSYVDHGGASAFLQHMIEGDFKAASLLCSRNFEAINQSWIQGKRRGLESYWDRFTEGNLVLISDPAVLLDNDPLENDMYFYPASVGDKRALMYVGIRNHEVTYFMIDTEFEVIERALYDLIHGNFQDMGKYNQVFGISMLSSPEDIEDQWNEILLETGKYVSSDPPYAVAMFDAAPYFFPSNFENGRYIIKIGIGYVYPQNGKAVYFDVYPC